MLPFDFPPREKDQWVQLTPEQRRHWLKAAQDRFFARAQAEGGVPRAPGRTIIIDGRLIDGLQGFFCAIGEAVNGPGGYFGLATSGFDDSLFGGFGLDAPYTIVWQHSSQSKQHLGADALAEWLKSEKAYWLESERSEWLRNDEADEKSFDEIAESWAEGAETMFDVLVDLIRSVPERGHQKEGVVLVLE